MKTIVLIISLLWWINVVTQAQCDRTLVQKATEQAGKDAVLVRDFKVKLKEGDKRNPSPSSRFSVLMQNGISYRFNIVGAIENAEIPVLQLYDKSNLLASTFDFDKKQNGNNFLYQCPRTGDYQVILSFRNGKAGCAAGVMSMIVDSAFLSVHNQSESPEEEVLYLGIDNQLNVSMDSISEDKFDVSVDNGIAVDKGTHYIIRTERRGNAKVTVKRKDSEGKVLEEIVKDFKVIPLPEPKVQLDNAKGDYVNSYDLSTANVLDIKPSVYRILDFYISNIRISRSGFRSNGEFISPEQRDFLKRLNSNEKFYINDITVEKPDGTIITIGSMEYFVR